MCNAKRFNDAKTPAEWLTFHEHLRSLVSRIEEQRNTDGSVTIECNESGHWVEEELTDLSCELQDAQFCRPSPNGTPELPRAAMTGADLFWPTLHQFSHALDLASDRAYQEKATQRVPARFVTDFVNAAHVFSNTLNEHMPDGMHGGTIGPTALVAWDENAEGFLEPEDAVKLCDGRFSPSQLVDLCTPDGRIRYMRKGKRIRINVRDLRGADRIANYQAADNSSKVTPPPMTPRQQEVYDCICMHPDGIQGRQLAEECGMGESTLRSHMIPELKRNHGVKNRRGAGYYI